MLILFVSTLLLCSLIFGAWSIRASLALRGQLVDLRADHESLRLALDENDQLRRLVNYSQHTRQSIEMIEDLSACFSDIDHELKQTYRYLFARLKNADSILAAGRPGPLAYRAGNTQERPPRPGRTNTPVKLWHS